MRNAIYEFDPVVFPLMLFVAVADSDEFLEENFRTVNGEEVKIEIGDNDANTFYYLKRKDDDRRGILIQIPSSNPDIELIAHESYHYARRLLEYCNDEGSNETYALIIGWAAKCVNKAAKEYQAETDRLYEQGICCSGDIQTSRKITLDEKWRYRTVSEENIESKNQPKASNPYEFNDVLHGLLQSGKISISRYVECMNNPDARAEISRELVWEKDQQSSKLEEKEVEEQLSYQESDYWFRIDTKLPDLGRKVLLYEVNSEKKPITAKFEGINSIIKLFPIKKICRIVWRYTDL